MACPSSICRSADRSLVPDAEEEAAKEAAFKAWAGVEAASSMASQPNTGSTMLHYGADHFQVSFFFRFIFFFLAGLHWGGG
jgi:hypothetical protein